MRHLNRDLLRARVTLFLCWYISDGSETLFLYQEARVLIMHVDTYQTTRRIYLPIMEGADQCTSNPIMQSRILSCSLESYHAVSNPIVWPWTPLGTLIIVAILGFYIGDVGDAELMSSTHFHISYCSSAFCPLSAPSCLPLFPTNSCLIP